jgi:hypothetical protein
VSAEKASCATTAAAARVPAHRTASCGLLLRVLCCALQDQSGVCPVPSCRRQSMRLTRHISLTHGPQPAHDLRTGVFVLAVVRRPEDGRFLMVQVGQEAGRSH